MSKKENYFIQVTLTPEQVGVLNDALDVYSRIHIGQFHRVLEEFWDKLPDPEAVERMEAALYAAKKEAFPELIHGPNHSHSMRSSQGGREARLRHQAGDPCSRRLCPTPGRRTDRKLQRPTLDIGVHSKTSSKGGLDPRPTS